MTRTAEIPGLISITEEPVEGGGARFIFEIEDDKEDQFFSAFGLASGDHGGFQRVILEALELHIRKQDEEHPTR